MCYVFDKHVCYSKFFCDVLDFIHEPVELSCPARRIMQIIPIPCTVVVDHQFHNNNVISTTLLPVLEGCFT